MDNSRRLELEAKFSKARERLVRALKWLAPRGSNVEKLADEYLASAREELEFYPVNAVALADRITDRFANEAIWEAQKAFVRAEAELAATHLHLSENSRREVEEAKNAAAAFERRGLYSSALGKIAYALRIVREGLPRREMRAGPRPTRTGKTAKKGDHRNARAKADKSARDRALRLAMKGGGGGNKK